MVQKVLGPLVEVTDIEKARGILKKVKSELKLLQSIPFFARGHQDNEEILKLQFRKKQLQTTIKLLKKNKIKPAAPVEPTKIHYHGEYI